MTDNRFDVLIVGGGPAGSTIAALLAQRGETVVLVEKDTHPRFHIGESLLPMNLPLFEALGVKQQIDRIGMPKYGASLPLARRHHPARFRPGLGQSLFYPMRRGRIDRILWQNATTKAPASSKAAVSQVEFPPDGGVVATDTTATAGRRFRRSSWSTHPAVTRC